jgi:hypothetical protein
VMRLSPIARLAAAQPVSQLHAQAAAALAQALRQYGIVAQESAGTGSTVRVLVVSRSAVRLTEQIDIVSRDGTLWFCWSGQPLCRAEDTRAAADMIRHLLASDTRAGMASAGRPGDA